MNFFVFVYGTLLKGLQRERALSRSQFIGQAWIQGLLYDLGSYPGLKEGGGKVFGELYSVDQATLNYLNRIEGYDSDAPENSLYIRKKITVSLAATDETLEAESYFYNRPILETKRITHGDYRAYLEEQALQQKY